MRARACLRVHVHMYVCPRVCGGLRPISGNVLDCFLPYFWEGLHLCQPGVQVSYTGWPANHRDPPCLCLPGAEIIEITGFLVWAARNKLYSSHLQ